MKKIPISLIFILLILPIVDASIVSRTAEQMSPYLIHIGHPTVNDQMIIRIPYNALYNVKTITGYDSYANCFTGSGSTYPNLPMHIRTYTYNRSGYDVTYILKDNINIYNTSCSDYGAYLHINLITPLDIESAVNAVPENIDPMISAGIAFGFWTEDDATASSPWGFPYSTGLNYGNKLYQTFDNTQLYYAAMVVDINNYGFTNPLDNTEVYSSKITVYGTYQIPQTPLPTPPETCVGHFDGEGHWIDNCASAPLPCVDCDGILPGDGNFNTNGTTFTPDWDNLTYCPTCLGNETSNITGAISNATGFCSILITSGYGSNAGCTSKDFIDYLYDWSSTFFWLSILLLMLKIYLLYRG
jgi:hypothetical protein